MIKLEGTEGTDGDNRSQAFKRPKDGSRITYNRKLETVGWYAHLVHLVQRQEHLVKFYGIDLNAPDKPETGAPFEVSLSRHDLVWVPAPCTLNEWDDTTNNCCILFLSDSYTKANPTLAAGDPIKWPKQAGIAEIEQLTGQLDELKERLRSFRQTLASADKPGFDKKFQDVM